MPFAGEDALRRRSPLWWILSATLLLLFLFFLSRFPSVPFLPLSSSSSPPPSSGLASAFSSLVAPARDSSGASGTTAMEDLRGFAIAWRAAGGFLVLRSEKKSKGLHFQIPGGHAEFPQDAASAADFLAHQTVPVAPHSFSASGKGPEPENKKKHVDEEEVARATCARELYEETGIDVREDLNRLVPLASAGVGPFKNRFYFFLHLTDELLANAPLAIQAEDASKGKTRTLLYPDNYDHQSPELQVQLAVGLNEHTGFRLVSSAEEAAHLVTKHAGGRSTRALKAFQRLLDKHAPLSPLDAVRAATQSP
ncbi:putative NUDIX hydrolase domain protein [Toxoplasma gondii RUB]|uniref:Uncharacterized protein n=7 Tax=Toxoplasma gondii TaxID=5811 RepID=S7W0M7_TOXGG|nr:hypothetical protein TGGT1_242270 [Toxoplasma gondii GT1]KAF4643312.1 hypothetical protein TGRH88_029790 [Toxoplasma gondii]KFG32831.1 putative NUDIX hydrolase domain protein [Toxoplasma gondii GAB2-2007-GAL-DOM2]KFG51152.1 putative NUDIX hydrolase domain protein [Toxoplasma gondii FOU]KFG60133.1 putative NUDIX hydrolase domain protein [Toxoplasma gondii RUB]KFH06921.1 putative NUDIX hydrolase domain protein [Toxoplasma gondii MAS]RQX69022.1 putative NUDIX hydrolase domain protein [Toxopla